MSSHFLQSIIRQFALVHCKLSFRFHICWCTDRIMCQLFCYTFHFSRRLCITISFLHQWLTTQFATVAFEKEPTPTTSSRPIHAFSECKFWRLFLCHFQTLGFGPAEKENLDNWMAHIFQKNIPPHFNLLNSHGTTNPILHSHRHSKYHISIL